MLVEIELRKRAVWSFWYMSWFGTEVMYMYVAAVQLLDIELGDRSLRISSSGNFLYLKKVNM